jgi:hypothetical protein
MATDAPVEENRPDGGYAVTLVIRSSNEHHLQPPLELPDGSFGLQMAWKGVAARRLGGSATAGAS